MPGLLDIPRRPPGCAGTSGWRPGNHSGPPGYRDIIPFQRPEESRAPRAYKDFSGRTIGPGIEATARETTTCENPQDCHRTLCGGRSHMWRFVAFNVERGRFRMWVDRDNLGSF